MRMCDATMEIYAMAALQHKKILPRGVILHRIKEYDRKKRENTFEVCKDAAACGGDFFVF